MFKLTKIIIFILINNILYIKSDNKNIVAFKFKTYYPYNNNSLYNISNFTADDYYQSIHLSKLYLEVGVGDQNEIESKTNQFLNIIINLKEIILYTTDIYFDNFITENTNLLCHYNTSNSKTFSSSSKYYKIENIKSLSSYAKDLFQIYTDISLSKYKIQSLNFVNTINHNISNICGGLGLGYLHKESVDYNFIGQLHSKMDLTDYSFLFNYFSNNSDEGVFIFGNMPHKYSPDKYNIDNLIPIYSINMVEPIIKFYELKLERKGFLIDLKDPSYNLKINPDVEGFEFPNNIFIDLEDIFFEKYYGKKICHKEVVKKVYSVIYCDGKEKFGQEDINSFPNMILLLDKSTNFSISFKGEDLFYIQNDKYFFKIVVHVLSENIVLGRILFKKYLTIFNQEKRQIFFYGNNNNNNNPIEDGQSFATNKTNTIIIIILVIVCLIIFFPLGIYFGKYIFKKRNKKAYELNDGYDYSSTQNDKENLIVN